MAAVFFLRSLEPHTWRLSDHFGRERFLPDGAGVGVPGEPEGHGDHPPLGDNAALPGSPLGGE